MSEKKTTSKTEKESWVEERALGLGPHYKTTISSDESKVEGRGRTAEKLQEVASAKHKKRKN